MAFKKILLLGDAAALEAATAALDIGTAATAGVGATASKLDHVHIIAQSFITTGLIANRTLLAADISTMVITSNEMATDSINAVALDQTATYIMTAVGFQPQATLAASVEGSVFYDSTNDHLYINQGA